MGLTAGLVQEVSDPKFANRCRPRALRAKTGNDRKYPVSGQIILTHRIPSAGGDNLVKKIKESMMGWFNEL